MPYGTIKVDTITFTAGGVDTNVSISGLVQNPTFTGGITSTGTISGNIIQGGTTVSGATVTGTAGQFGTLTGNTAGFATVTGATVTGTVAQFTTITGGTAGFTTVTGTTVTGTTANFATLSGTTVTGNAGSFTTVTGGVATITSGVFAVGAAALPSISFSSDPNTGIYSPGADQVAISTGGSARLYIASDGKVGVGSTSFGGKLTVKTSSSNGAPVAWGDGQLVVTAGDGTTAPGFGISTNTSDNSVSLSALTPGTGWNNLHLRAAQTIFYKSDAASNEVGRWDASGRLLVGTSSDSSTARLMVEGNTSDGLAGVLDIQYGGTSPAEGANIGALRFKDRTSNTFYAAILCNADGATGAADKNGRLVFSTTADGASSPTERMRINSLGALKASSSNQAYVSSTLVFHELIGNHTGEATVIVKNFNGSYNRPVLEIDCVRAANSAYSLLQAYSGGFADTEFLLRGDGNGLCDGAWTGGGADYAEYFEWSDDNPDAEDRRGISVVLDGGKIREAVAGEDPIGVISGNPSVVGDAAWNKWSGKYLRDEFGTYIQEDYEVEDEDGNTVVQQRRKLNPAYDPDAEYIPREQRPEWDCVGLMGKLRIRKGQVTGSLWIKMRDISDSVEEWLVR